ncbi:hypothetical protein K6119_17930 [Paracrocinitomix mangrovi]|uniref:chemotaxis protein CheC n=1 Tax=Paracrocinitomix mangrovi TaxID=2862509 RepID=UPI001C8D0D3D|nr:hypothetical protein [Paracrocinitomix mangrovi]UKN01605.1 hypothetical protein K6119_17930 [Paracrocinitomix mangrovi]
MDLEFDKTELELTKELINVGLEKAAQSMAFFTKDEVSIHSTDVQIKPMSFIGRLLSKEDNQELAILSTEIMGEVGGVCYLIFSEEEVNRILEVSLPESVRNDPDKLKVMGDAILLEMDNIIVASVVTQLANALNYKMYGNVPAISRTLPNGFMQIFSSARNSTNYFLYFKSEFKTKGLDINPDFIWLLDDNYLEGVKNVIVQNNDIIEKIRKAKNQ